MIDAVEVFFIVLGTFSQKLIILTYSIRLKIDYNCSITRDNAELGIICFVLTLEINKMYNRTCATVNVIPWAHYLNVMEYI